MSTTSKQYKVTADHSGIEILDEQFVGTIYKYGKVSFTEDNDDDKLIMHFDYDIINNKEVDGPEFQQYIGDVLLDIIEKQLIAGEIVYTGGVDESDRTESSDQSDIE